ncbi:MAG: TetR/AcrR family transcriptional regulator C-terminal domain-containing protein [Sphaerochaeta sp.]|nr:TetR/AcrR family transcriptional regulator C-terminal domain-containing protein [Sphaerochaeta sp.]
MAQMTKSALAQSLKQLMADKTLDKITVKEIVARCGVNRQTFYYHFRDIYDLLDWMFINEGNEFSRAYPNAMVSDDGQTAVQNLCFYLLENREMIVNIYHSLGRELLDRYLCREISKLLYATLEKRAKDFGATSDDLDFLIGFYKHAFVGHMLDWVQDGLPGSCNEIVLKFSPLLKGTFDSALKRMALSH